MTKLNEFIEYLNQEVQHASLYAWGGQGEAATPAAIERRESEENNRERVMRLYEQRISQGYGEMKLFDCSGLATYYLYNLKKLIPSDTTANGLKGKCQVLSRSELTKGDWVFRVYQTAKIREKPITSDISWMRA